MSSSAGLPQYPYLLLRRYLCGHPEEAIWVEKDPSGQVIHYIVHRYRPRANEKRPTSFTLVQCTKCATENPRQKARVTAVNQGMPKRKLDGFTAALDRYKHGNNAHGEIIPHEKLDESSQV
jgi:hypothetical protein